ncbi:MAG: hypothetical protein GEU98_09565 [Pseudonocardiaceae bacterium]|nr:hypothetical protein [Pseudonocardiaceae bacterium]
MPWILGGVGAVVVIGLAVTLIFALGGGAGDPKEVADKAIQAMSEKNPQMAKEVACNPSAANDTVPKQLENVQLKVTLDGEITEDGDTASAPIKMEINYLGRSQEVTGNMKLAQQDGEWCVDDFESTGGS